FLQPLRSVRWTSGLDSARSIDRCSAIECAGRMRITARSTMTSDGGGGTSEDDEGYTRRSPLSLPVLRWGCSSRLLLVAVAALLVVQQPAAAAVAAASTERPTTELNANLGSEIEIPSAAEVIMQQANANRNDTETSSVNGKGKKKEYDLDFNGEFRTVLKRSEKTMEEFASFIDNTCRDIDNVATFLSWEQDQFAIHLKTNILSIAPGRTADKEVSEQLRSLMQPDVDITKALASICKPKSMPIDWQIDEVTEANILENEIINTIFSTMYRQHSYPIPGGNSTDSEEETDSTDELLQKVQE
ncbi:hypothetical protein PFISCL1PPCAC_6779, partial [Pristionchus fissidentatus]